MLHTKLLDAAMCAFRQKFAAICQDLDSEALAQLNPHSMRLLSRALQDAAQAAGQAGLQTFLQENDRRVASVEYAGKTYRYKASVRKTFLTLFGNLTVDRSVYGNDLEGGYVVPLDRRLHLTPEDSATLEAREVILFAASSSTPQEIETLFSKVGLCRPSRTAIQNIITRDGERMETLREPLAQGLQRHLSPPADARVLVASMDGANLRLREPGVKTGRPAQRPTDSCAQEDAATTFRNAMVGTISWYGRDTDGAPHRIHTTYLARMPQDGAPSFKQEFERGVAASVEAAMSLPKRVRNVLLCDGHRTIWNYAKSTPLFDDFHFLLDFYHTTEHLSKAAEAIFGASSPEGQRWYNKWREALKADVAAPQSIIRSIDGYLKRCRIPAARKADLRRERTFFMRNKHMMTYPRFIEQGLPIGSGPVEAAAKTIVKQRMCRSGMRWSRPGGQHVLTLRAQIKSETWERYWRSYTELLKAA